MLKAGLIRKFAAGIYSYLPLGYRVLSKITSIIREEMDKTGAQEMFLPFVQPGQLWKRSRRWDNYGEELARFKDRKGVDFVLSPTHEEIITQLVKQEINSYKRLPLILYQIQIKFRDELRPRGGVIRAREFLMKDAYSFCRDKSELISTYEEIKKAYQRIFSRCELNYKIVEADTGPIGGERSEEFIALGPSGEDKIVICDKCGYTAKLEKAEYALEEEEEEEPQEIKEVFTPDARSVGKLSQLLNCDPARILKTIFYQVDDELIAVLIRGDHQINEEKLRRVLKVKRVKLANKDLVKDRVGVEVGFAGPLGLDKCKLIADNEIMKGRNFIGGANKKDFHLLNLNPCRDFQPAVVKDIRFFIEGDRCPRCRGSLNLKRGIEVGHLFQLGEKYSRDFEAAFLDEKGEKRYFAMGCYGIGVSRLPAAIIEQNYDERGIIWPRDIAPFDVIVIPTTNQTFRISEEVYLQLKETKIEVLWDDRDVSAGVKFADSDLIGIPFKVIIGNTFLKEGKIEIKDRRKGRVEKVEKKDLSGRIKELVQDAR
jgi:prolyl-tRNA synthetase